MTNKIFALVFILIASTASAQTVVPVEFLNGEGSTILAEKIRATYATADTRSLRAEKSPHGWTIRIFSKRYHKFESAQMDLDGGAQVYSKSLRVYDAPVCPDLTIQFIAFAPNDDAFEIGIAKEAADAAISHGLKTVFLQKKDATGAAFLNYLACPKIVGDFYDGDANPDEIVTADGTLTSEQIAASGLNFNYHVTHIWLACEAYNHPMLGTMIDTVRSKKYAAGINDLEIGPSDHTAACAMKAALDGEPMTAAFKKCQDTLDNKTDQWGFGGAGTDSFGK